MARYLRDNAYYTLQHMDLTSFTHIFPAAVPLVESREEAIVRELLSSTEKPLVVCADKTVKDRVKRRKKGGRNENLISLHQMSARVHIANNGKKRQPKRLSLEKSGGIFSKQKQSNLVSAEEPEFDIQTLSVDSMDNILTSATRYLIWLISSELDYHRNRRSDCKMYM